ncbi:adhesive plaque matrix protein-like [Eriocheir sinensis]|uniref:adhesive plaque matrix protein-like n=1 Tax=Eriocheir sinensis TaxID=95602 RepID=UPI0021CA32F7|nr:adhesive plaque matrix protein-like [Eriocheir sinensis]
MSLKLAAALALLAVVLAEQSSHVSFSLGGAPAITHASVLHRSPAFSPAPFHQRPAYPPRPTYRPNYGPEPRYPPKPHYRPAPYHPEPRYPQPPPHYRPQPAYPHKAEIPACAKDNPKPWCLEDKDYPTYEIEHAAEQHFDKLLSLYADVADLNTELSVYGPKTLEEETYLCPSATGYVKPLRAINTEGKWRVIVNGIKVHYETLTQTTRLEECLKESYACPLVPECYESKCLQKSIYHRFLVFDPYDKYFPFAVETFKLPASCACLLGASTLDH